MAVAKPKKAYKAPKSFSAKKKAMQLKQTVLVLIVGGVLLGGLALAFTNTRKSQDVRSDASGGTRVCVLTFRNKNCENVGTYPSRSLSTSAFATNIPSVTCNNSGAESTVEVPSSLTQLLLNKVNSEPDNWPNGVQSSERTCWIEPNFVPEPTSTGSTPVSGSDDEKIIVGGTVYACDGSKLANVPVKAYGNTAYTNAQGKWEVRKNTAIIANGIQEFTVLAGKDANANHATYYTSRQPSSGYQFPKVSANCGKVSCDLRSTSGGPSRFSYGVNKYVFGTDLPTYRRWFVTSTAAPNPFVGFDFKPVDCAPTASANINVSAAISATGTVSVSTSVAPKAGLTVSKVQFAYRKKGSLAWEKTKLKNVSNANSNGQYSAAYTISPVNDRIGGPGEYEFSANVYFNESSTLPCTGNNDYVGPWFTKCGGKKSVFVNWNNPSPND